MHPRIYWHVRMTHDAVILIYSATQRTIVEPEG
jgi:hypothetical protein